MPPPPPTLTAFRNPAAASQASRRLTHQPRHHLRRVCIRREDRVEDLRDGAALGDEGQAAVQRQAVHAPAVGAAMSLDRLQAYGSVMRRPMTSISLLHPPSSPRRCREMHTRT
jgi:hypothetical protein